MVKFQRKRSISPNKNQPQNTSPSLSSTPAPQSTIQTTLNDIRSRITSKNFLAPIALSSAKSNFLFVEKKTRPLSSRNSTLSILDDPFFRNYTSPQTVFLARELESAISAGYLEHEKFSEYYPSLPPSTVSVENSSLIENTNEPESKVSDINIGIIGVTGVGKSSLIQGALGLSSPPNCLLSTLRFSNKDMVHTINLFELDLDATLINWQREFNGHDNTKGCIASKLHGVLLLCDVTNRKSLERFPAILNKFSDSSLPTILVSCKCDLPLDSHQVNIDDIKKNSAACIDTVTTAINDPDSARTCLTKILKVILENKKMSQKITDRDSLSIASESPSSKISSDLGMQHVYSDVNHNQSPKSRRSLADTSSILISPLSLHNHQQNTSPSIVWAGTQQNQSQPEKPDLISVSPSSEDNMNHHDTPKLPIDERPSPRRRKVNETYKNTKKNFMGSYLSDIEFSFQHSEELPVLQGNDENDHPSLKQNHSNTNNQSYNNDSTDTSSIEMCTMLDGFVDRLIGQTISKSDKIFIDVFLCLYRQFATPGELLSSILNRLQILEEERTSYHLIRKESLFRILNIISKWITTYPGDFAGPSTSKKLVCYLDSVIDKPEFAPAAIEIKLNLRTRVVIDDDSRWGKVDPDIESSVGAGISETVCNSSFGSHPPHKQTQESYLSVNLFNDEGNGETSPRIYRLEDRGTIASPEYAFSFAEDFNKEVATLIPRNALPLSKIHFHIFMQMSEDEISNEITRIDWVLFSAIRLRDLVRHVCHAPNAKKNWKGLKNVNRSINHFNHVTRWVANMILMRDKAKQRAMVLEKFVKIALKLRFLNNYNGLAAVLAGINGCPVYRLTYTWNIVPSDILERLDGLMMLMGTHRSYFRYRLAWRNSNSFRIPFLPLHRRDLVLAEEVSRRFLDMSQDSINQKKFEVFSEIITPIMKSQTVPCPILMKSKTTRDLILDCKILNDEELYNRSLAVESSASPVAESGKKRFFWF